MNSPSISVSINRSKIATELTLGTTTRAGLGVGKTQIKVLNKVVRASKLISKLSLPSVPIYNLQAGG